MKLKSKRKKVIAVDKDIYGYVNSYIRKGESPGYIIGLIIDALVEIIKENKLTRIIRDKTNEDYWEKVRIESIRKTDT
jgi:hypothetical protein